MLLNIVLSYAGIIVSRLCSIFSVLAWIFKHLDGISRAHFDSSISLQPAPNGIRLTSSGVLDIYLNHILVHDL